MARFVSATGKRIERYFDSLPEARNWLEDAKHEDKHGQFVVNSEMTVDEWFEFWLENIVCDLAPNTRRNYLERYIHNIQPVIGKMCIGEVKSLHCKAVLNRMDPDYADATRAIESGMSPKALQHLLGQASIKTTMDRYVHVTGDSMLAAVRQFEKMA